MLIYVVFLGIFWREKGYDARGGRNLSVVGEFPLAEKLSWAAEGVSFDLADLASEKWRLVISAYSAKKRKGSSRQ